METGPGLSSRVQTFQFRNKLSPMPAPIDQSSRIRNPSAPRKGVSFRSSLLRNLILLILLLSSATLTISYFGAQRAMRFLCKDLVVSRTERLESELRRFFEPVPLQLALIEDWVQQGLLEDFEPATLNPLLAPILAKSTHISSINAGDAEGNGQMLLRTGDTWTNRSVTPGTPARFRQGKIHGTPLKEWKESVDYDPRTRPWYQLAMSQPPGEDEVVWTEPYTFFTTREPGITASVRAHRPGAKEIVLAVDVLLKDISAMTQSLEISPKGFAFVIDHQGQLVGLPKNERFENEKVRNESYLKHPRDLGIPVMSEVFLKATAQYGLKLSEHGYPKIEQLDPAKIRPFFWKSDGRGWWSYLRPLQGKNSPHLWIGVAVPEEDFLGELRQQQKQLLTLFLLALAVGTLISLQLAKRYSKPIEDLIGQSERLTRLDTTGTEMAPSGILELAQLGDAHERMRVALDSFARYVPDDVVRELLKNGEAAVIGGKSLSISILFTDIKGFSALSEKLSPMELTHHMAEYFDAMIGIIRQHHGTVDKLIGDAIVAFWGAPTPSETHAHDAVRSAWECHLKLQELAEAWKRRGLPPLPTRFGLATGVVVVGNVGSPSRLSYTALGDSMNLASRLEGANSFYSSWILASESTVREAGEEFVWRQLDRVRVKGRNEPESIYELLGPQDSLSDAIRSRKKAYESAFTAYLARDFSTAVQILETLPEDASAVRLMGICRDYLESPPPPDWDGVFQFQSKS